MGVNVVLRVSNGQFVCAENGGGQSVVANRNGIGPWQTFTLHELGGGNIALQAPNGQFFCAEGGGGQALVANRNSIGPWETFARLPAGAGIALRAANGQFVCAEGGGGHELVANRNQIGAWEIFDLLNAPQALRTIALQADNGKFVCAEGGGGYELVANRSGTGPWEVFWLFDMGNGRVALRTLTGQFVCAEGGGSHALVANRPGIGAWEMFTMLELGNGRIALLAVNNRFVCAEGGGGRELIANRDAVGPWETFRRIENPVISSLTAYISVNLILVGRQLFTNADLDTIAQAMEVARGIFGQVGIGFDVVSRFQIPSAAAGAATTIDDAAEAEDLTEDWTVRNGAIDVFVVTSMFSAGRSPVDGSCDKDSKGMNGVVVSMTGGVAFFGNTIAHEIGHYLGLEHIGDPGNFIGNNGNSGSATGIFGWQGDIMREHCFIHQ
jgi:Metallo-peptidase family M12B Reprolysin-like/Fascin domain